MVFRIVEVYFKGGSKPYYFKTDIKDLKKRTALAVMTRHGVEKAYFNRYVSRSSDRWGNKINPGMWVVDRYLKYDRKFKVEAKSKYALQWTDGHITKNHGIFKSIEDAYDSIAMWWDLNDFKPNYVRKWTINGVTTIDYGMHHMFYKITEIDKDNFAEVLNLLRDWKPAEDDISTAQDIRSMWKQHLEVEYKDMFEYGKYEVNYKE